MTNSAVTKDKKWIKISNTPPTWIGLDAKLSNDQVAERINNYKQLTGIK